MSLDISALFKQSATIEIKLDGLFQVIPSNFQCSSEDDPYESDIEKIGADFQISRAIQNFFSRETSNPGALHLIKFLDELEI